MNAPESTPATPPAQPPPAHQPSFRFYLWTALAAAVIVVAFLAGWVPRSRDRADLANQTRELSVATVTVVSPAPGKAGPGLLLPAEIKPWIEAPIHARASGYLKRWLVDLGARVAAGQLLAEIETPELDQELDRVRHELTQAEAAQTLAKITAERSAHLATAATISAQENDQKQSDLTLRIAAVEAARASVRRLEGLQAFARVTAPFAGVITARQTDVGNLIAAGSARELFRLAQTDRLRTYVRVPQTRALAVGPGQTAELLIPELPNRVFPARVTGTAGAISADSRTLLVQLEVDNARGEILAGSFGQVRFTGVADQAPLTLPSNTLLFRPEGPQVGVVPADGKVELRSVKLGRDFGPTVEILAGVTPADRVILNPADSLAGGATVRVSAPAQPENVR